MTDKAPDFEIKPEARPPRRWFGIDAIRARVLLAKAADVTQTITTAGKMVTEVLAKPSVPAIIAAAVTTAATHFNGLTKKVDRAPDGWHYFSAGVDLRQELAGFEVPEVHNLFTFGGQRLLLIDNNSGHVEFCVETFLAQLRQLIWAKYNNSASVKSLNRDGCELETSDNKPVMNSPRADAVWCRIRQCIQRGVPRSILLNGRPGTGKSTMARMLAKNVGGTELRIPLATAGRFQSEDCQDLIETLKPDTIIIDDFDRMGSEAIACLDALEEVRKQVRLFVVTTNNLRGMDPAIVRCERIDETFEVGSLGANYMITVTGPELWASLSEEQRKAVIEWPVVFIRELVIRANNYEGFVLDNEYQDLSVRVERNNKPTWAQMRRIDDDGLEDRHASGDEDTASFEEGIANMLRSFT